MNLGQYQRAIQDYDQAIHVNPQYANAYAGRALAYTIISMDAEAQQDVDRAVELGFNRTRLDSTIDELRKQR